MIKKTTPDEKARALALSMLGAPTVLNVTKLLNGTVKEIVPFQDRGEPHLQGRMKALEVPTNVDTWDEILERLGSSLESVGEKRIRDQMVAGQFTVFEMLPMRNKQRFEEEVREIVEGEGDRPPRYSSHILKHFDPGEIKSFIYHMDMDPKEGLPKIVTVTLPLRIAPNQGSFGDEDLEIFKDAASTGSNKIISLEKEFSKKEPEKEATVGKIAEDVRKELFEEKGAPFSHVDKRDGAMIMIEEAIRQGRVEWELKNVQFSKSGSIQMIPDEHRTSMGKKIVAAAESQLGGSEHRDKIAEAVGKAVLVLPMLLGAKAKKPLVAAKPKIGALARELGGGTLGRTRRIGSEGRVV